MVQYSIQCNDIRHGWMFIGKAELFPTIEEAQERLVVYIKRWIHRKNKNDISYRQIDRERFVKPENWRIVQREITDWEPVR